MYIFAGDSWAEKAFNESNWRRSRAQPGDRRLADHWPWPYRAVTCPGGSNLDILRAVADLNSDAPVVWVWTEPGRDWALCGPDSTPHSWMLTDQWRSQRDQAAQQCLQQIRQTLPNPIAFIGGLSDIDPDLVRGWGYHCLCASWQGWIAAQQPWTDWHLGWGASDVGWRTHTIAGFEPGRAVTEAWHQQIQEWSAWEQAGWFCHEHPTELACAGLAQHLLEPLQEWFDECR